MLAKGHITPKERPKELDHLSSNNPSKVRTILIPQQVITQDLNHQKRKVGVSNARKWVMELKIVEYILLKKSQITSNPI
jgi:hypothetical protein